MIFVHPDIETHIDTGNGRYNTLVIENQGFMTAMLTDITEQLAGRSGQAVLSKHGKPLPISKHLILLDRFIPFNLNQKALINHIVSAMIDKSNDPAQFEPTAEVMRAVENWLNELTYDLPCEVVFPKLMPSMLIKTAAPEILCAHDSIAERVLDLMELISEFEHGCLFVTVNMRAFVPDEEMALFSETVVSHGHAVLALEGRELPILPSERRILIDKDLCEIDYDSPNPPV